jgi:general secretion pathway protein J
MLVALMVFSVLVALVYGMVRMGSRSWESGMARIDETDAMRIGWTFLQRSLNNTRVVPSKIAETEGIHFSGAADRLEYVADMPAYLGSGGLHLLTLSVERQGLGRDEREQLVLRRMLLSDYEDLEGEAADPEAVQQAVLNDRLDRLDVQYYGVLEDDESPAWHAEWREQNALPVLIKIAVTPEGQDAWPVLVAHPRFGGDRLDDLDEDADRAEEEPVDPSEPPASDEAGDAR